MKNVVVTWVGEVRKKIVYHGDVLNTTARIQRLGKELRQELLIAQELLAPEASTAWSSRRE